MLVVECGVPPERPEKWHVCTERQFTFGKTERSWRKSRKCSISAAVHVRGRTPSTGIDAGLRGWPAPGEYALQLRYNHGDGKGRCARILAILMGLQAGLLAHSAYSGDGGSVSRLMPTISSGACRASIPVHAGHRSGQCQLRVSSDPINLIPANSPVVF